MENNPNPTSGGAANDVKSFFKEDFKEMFMAFFTNPVNGHHTNFQKSSEKALLQASILMGSVFVIFLLCLIIMLGTANFSVLIKISIIPVSMMAMISAFSFGVKSISGTPDMKKEMLTGGLCGIPLALGMIIITLLSFVSDSGMNPMGGSTLSMIIMLYLLLMMIGVFQQSLTAAGTKDTVAWYASPAAIVLAGYLTSKLIYGIL